MIDRRTVLAAPLALRRGHRPIEVFDTTSPRWSTLIAAQVEAYNAGRGAGCRALRYQREAVGFTSHMPGINVGNVSVIGPGPGCPQCAYTSWHQGVTSITIEDTDETFAGGPAVVCHEFVHALAHVTDGAHDQDSCMRGSRSDLGSWDWAVITARLCR